MAKARRSWNTEIAWRRRTILCTEKKIFGEALLANRYLRIESESESGGCGIANDISGGRNTKNHERKA